MHSSTVTSGFADAWPRYRAAGWPVFPLRAGTKNPPPSGVTGWEGVDASGADCHAWSEDPRYRDTTQLAVRMPAGVIGIDVDAYGDKTGAQTFSEAMDRWGPLPPTWRSSARPGPSGIWIYKVPDGVILADRITFTLGRDTGATTIGDIEIIQRHHRFAVTWPSIHPSTGRQYHWGGDDVIPDLADVTAELPNTWIDGLSRAAAAHESAGPEQVAELLAGIRRGKACRTVTDHLRAACSDARRTGNRHDSVRDHVLRLLRSGEQDHPGVPEALELLQRVFVDAVTADGSRTEALAEAEFDRFTGGGAARVAATPTEQPRGCRCDQTEPPLTRERLAAMVARVRRADDTERPDLTRWAQRRLTEHVRAGRLPAEYAEKLARSLEALA